MLLTNYFDQIIILYSEANPKRISRLKENLKPIADFKKITWKLEVCGDDFGCPAWWQQGNGSWGCLLSHVEIYHLIMKNDYEKILILEDDAIFDHNLIKDDFPTFMEKIPDDWGQIYLGGLHQSRPERGKYFFSAKSVNRTHAYAVQRKYVPDIHRHVLHFPDYYANPERHIDHQLEAAHQRGDWPVYCPFWWFAGQGENSSRINGDDHPDKWWDWAEKRLLKKIPWIVINANSNDVDFFDYLPYLHFGWDEDLKENTYIEEELHKYINHEMEESVENKIISIADQAFSTRRLPAFRAQNKFEEEAIKKYISSQIELEETPEFNIIEWFKENIKIKIT